jgi:hypothetical protein
MAMQSNTVTEISADGVIERELTAEEFAEIKSEQDRLAQEKAAADAQGLANADAKATLLERLGITIEEAKLLLS